MDLHPEDHKDVNNCHEADRVDEEPPPQFLIFWVRVAVCELHDYNALNLIHKLVEKLQHVLKKLHLREEVAVVNGAEQVKKANALNLDAWIFFKKQADQHEQYSPVDVDYVRHHSALGLCPQTIIEGPIILPKSFESHQLRFGVTEHVGNEDRNDHNVEDRYNCA